MLKPDLPMVIMGVLILVTDFFLYRKAKNWPSSWKFGLYIGTTMALLIVVWYVVAIIADYLVR